jgi:fatty-acyl-CoA synthase
MSWHIADIFEAIADAIPDANAITDGERIFSWRDHDDRSARLATIFAEAGLVRDAKIALYAYNCAEYLEAHHAAFKARMQPININYRYEVDELVYVLTNSDSEAIVFQARFAPRVAAIRDRIPAVKLFLEIDDGSGEHLDGALAYEQSLLTAKPAPRIERSGSDRYMLYTGGTTGLPKGVIYEHEGFAKSLFQRGFQRRGLLPPESAADFGISAREQHALGTTPRSIPACPLMHGTGIWLGAMLAHAMAGSVILFDNRNFDADRLWRAAQASDATEITIAGDVFAKPMLASLQAAEQRGEPFVLPAFKLLRSSGVMFSQDVKRELIDRFDITIIDSMGSSEGSLGATISNRTTIAAGKTGNFAMLETTKVFTDDGREVVPGSGEAGWLCNGGTVPVSYYKDPVKSAATFREFGGHRYSVPGDLATVAADGSIVLLGRGSMCINSGGEKIYPDEVEQALKSHDAVYDALVVGLPDDKFGERVTAVVSLADGTLADVEALRAHVRSKLAGYKIPKDIVIVSRVPRAENGKADYPAAKQQALEGISART